MIFIWGITESGKWAFVPFYVFREWQGESKKIAHFKSISKDMFDTRVKGV